MLNLLILSILILIAPAVVRALRAIPARDLLACDLYDVAAREAADRRE